MALQKQILIDITGIRDRDMLVYDSGTGTWNVESVMKSTTQAGTTYTLQDSDHNTQIRFSHASPKTVTIPAGLRNDFLCSILNESATPITFVDDGTSEIVNADEGTQSKGEGADVLVQRATASDKFYTRGAMI